MSNEPNPSPSALRLKPRLRPAEGAATAVVVDAAPPAVALADAVIPAPTAATVEADPSAIRLKPKLSPAPAGVPVAASAPAAAPQVAFIPAPPLVPPAPPTPPPAFIPAPPPVAVVAPLVPPPVAPAPADAGKFKFKPKTPGPAPLPALFVPEPGAAPVTTAAAPVAVPPLVPAFVPPPAPGAESPKTPPPGASPVPGRGLTTPAMPVPHMNVTVQPEVVAPPVSSRVAPKPPKSRGASKVLVTLLVLAVLGAAGYFAWPRFGPTLIGAVMPAAKKPAPTAAATPSSAPATAPATVAVAAPAPTAAPSTPALTPSETLNKLAHMPANAINKAQDAISARRSSGQSRIDAASVGEDVAGPSFGVPPAAPIKPATPAAAPTKAPPTAMTTVAPGLAATTHVEAAPEASAAFRAFVTNAKVSGVFQGNPARAVINGKLTRAGDLVDEGLGVRFDGLDAARRNLVFKDGAGAIVSRRF